MQRLRGSLGNAAQRDIDYDGNAVPERFEYTVGIGIDRAEVFVAVPVVALAAGRICFTVFACGKGVVTAGMVMTMRMRRIGAHAALVTAMRRTVAQQHPEAVGTRGSRTDKQKQQRYDSAPKHDVL